MGKISFKKYILFYLAIAMVCYQNCSPLESSNSNNNSLNSNGNVEFEVVQKIFSDNCTDCHSDSLASGDVNLSTYDNIMVNIIPGDSKSSLIYQVIEDGTMPPGGSISADQLKKLAQWIDAGALDKEPDPIDPDPIDPDPIDPDPVDPANVLPTANAGANKSITLPTSTTTLTGTASDSDGTVTSTVWTVVSGTPTPTLTNADTLTVSVAGMTTAGNYVFRLTVTDNEGGVQTDEATVTVVAGAGPTVTYAQVKPILEARCYNCHTGNNPSGGYNMATYNGVKGNVVNGNPNASELYIRVRDNIMPPPPRNPLSTAQKNTIRDWIMQGAVQ